MTEMPRLMWTMATMTALSRVMILPAGRMCVMLSRMIEVFVLFYIKYVATSTVTTASRWWTWRRRPLIAFRAASASSCFASAGRFLGIFPGRAAALCRPRLRQTCEKTARRRLHTPASQTRTLSRRQCARRLPKNQGYKASPRSALSADGEANKGTRSADPPARHRSRRRGLAQRPARHGRAQRPRKSGSPAGTRRHRGLCLGAGRNRPRATTPCPSA